MPYERFKVLLDEPADQPALGFPGYASAFAEIIRHSPPQFAIGLFGDWGSGKTTLMQAIERQLEQGPADAAGGQVVTVWFNAWRYEREPHLVVPMLDTLREALVEWSRLQSGDAADAARGAAAKIGRAARALLAGFSLSARVPLGIAELEATFDPATVMEQLGDNDAVADNPSSFYHASFKEMKNAIEEFTQRGAKRVVVFVDDLDRCLPLRALEVLESMKLFFDLEGFVFVVGLDQSVIELAIEMKYHVDPGSADGQDGNGVRNADARPGSPISGRDYVKKIFQVPFTLPRIPTGELTTFFNELIHRAELDPEQQNDFAITVGPHVQYLAGDRQVNPRDVKRLLNAYTLQLKMLGSKLWGGLRPEIVIALQTISFRRDWQRLYDQLAADPDFFQVTLRAAIEDEDAVQDAWIRNAPIPQAFLRYLRGPARTLLEGDLEPYISSAESTRSAIPGLLTSQAAVARMLRQVEELEHSSSEAVSELSREFDRLMSELYEAPTHSPIAAEIRALLNRTSSVLKQVPPQTGDLGPWKENLRTLLMRIDDSLSELRRETGLGPQSS